MRVRLFFILAFAGLAGCMLPRPPANTAAYTKTCIQKAPLAAASYLFATTRLPDCRTPARRVTEFRADGLMYGAWSTDGLHFHDRADWKEQLRQRIAAPAKAPILYIHGFNNSNLAAITRAAAIQRATGREVIALTWPSYDKTVKYFWDESNMSWSMPEARVLFDDISAMRSDLTIVAHSMGNHLALDMLRRWKLRNHGSPLPVRQLIMAAPDVDRAWLIKDGGRDLGIPVTLYGSTRDQPLSASWRSHGYARAGDLSKWVTGTDNEFPYDKVPEITVVDTSAVSRGMGHADFIETKEGAADLCRTVNASPPVPDLPGRQKVEGHSNSWVLTKAAVPAGDCAELGEAAARIATGRSVAPGTP
jgi:esterase/lipase superfamily enzyme